MLRSAELSSFFSLLFAFVLIPSVTLGGSAAAATDIETILDRSYVEAGGWKELSHGNKVEVRAGDTLIADPKTARAVDEVWSGDEDPTLEAYYYDAQRDRSVYFSHHDVGFVQMDDWKDLDVDELWAAYLRGAEDQSRSLGITVTPLRWTVPPTLLAEQSVAFYGLEIQFGDNPPVTNLVVFDFGRRGYEEMTVVMDAQQFNRLSAKDVALETQAIHRFGPGYRYVDFSDGDKIAAAGAAAVIAGSLGVTSWGKGAKGGILAAIAVFFKKLWYILLIPFLWIGRKFFSGRRSED